MGGSFHGVKAEASGSMQLSYEVRDDSSVNVAQSSGEG